MTTLAHNLQNDQRFDDLLKRARDFGTASGTAKDVQIKFGLALVDAAYEGVIDMTPDKHGKGEDDALKLCAEYAIHSRGATQFFVGSDSAKVQIAKARTCIKLGGWTKGGRGEPINTVNQLMAIRRKLRADPNVAGSLDDAYSTLLRYARAQLKLDALMATAELTDFCMKPTPKPKTVEKKLKAIKKEIDKLISGVGGVQFTCPEFEAASKLVGESVRTCIRAPDPEEVEDEPEPERDGMGNRMDGGGEEPEVTDDTLVPKAGRLAVAALFGGARPMAADGMPAPITMDDLERARAAQEADGTPIVPDDEEELEIEDEDEVSDDEE